ncbi:PhoX family protein [Geodermatophilus sp. YIM 151500]|uniref:PhoX family protein n=1 Tax=Geodermatophilus sp. YIM 151500 TaxID=2984531 RepID=UPI0021E3D7F2|nr:PhoX family protein [Geodermatophilus sp. YIM 151500]MCV2489084.1 PhoX family protein [Geodermatophilus sp. YIM 151500]
MDGGRVPDGGRDGAHASEHGGLSRRTFLGGAAGVGIALTGCSPSVFGSGGGGGDGGADTAPPRAGYGALVADSRGRLALPTGFRYRVLAEAGRTRLDSGEWSPSDPDGAAAFARPGGGTVLVCNHEISGDEPHAVPHRDGFVYDRKAKGGTTTLVLDARGRVESHHVSLAGTSTNCAGGRTPWDTWLSCEETEDVLEERHGYVFEVDPLDDAANRNPRPIRALGRFRHEAVVVDPGDFRLYMTEDAGDPNGSLYRWTPPDDALPLGRGSLRRLADDAGTLEALHATAVDGSHVADLASVTEVGTMLHVEWREVPDRDARDRPVRRQFRRGEITRAHKLEGMWWGDDGAYVVSSYARDGDGTAHDGQVWRLDPSAGSLTLELMFAVASNADTSVDGPDNITVSPYGGVIIAEDGEGACHLMGATPEGEVFPLARNELTEGNAEFCGPTFSPDGRTLFANVQGPGIVFAIDGPWADLA